MKCPNKKCGRETLRLVILFHKDGSKVRGCPVCISKEPGDPKDKKLYTGKKFWDGEEAYGVNAVLEKNFLFEERVKRRARQRNILTSPPSQRTAEDKAWIIKNPPECREAIA